MQDRLHLLKVGGECRIIFTPITISVTMTSTGVLDDSRVGPRIVFLDSILKEDGTEFHSLFGMYPYGPESSYERDRYGSENEKEVELLTIDGVQEHMEMLVDAMSAPHPSVLQVWPHFLPVCDWVRGCIGVGESNDRAGGLCGNDLFQQMWNLGVSQYLLCTIGQHAKCRLYSDIGWWHVKNRIDEMDQELGEYINFLHIVRNEYLEVSSEYQSYQCAPAKFCTVPTMSSSDMSTRQIQLQARNSIRRNSMMIELDELLKYMLDNGHGHVLAQFTSAQYQRYEAGENLVSPNWTNKAINAYMLDKTGFIHTERSLEEEDMQGSITTRLERNLATYPGHPWKEYVQHLSNQVSTLRRAYRSSQAGCSGCKENESMVTGFKTCSKCNLAKYCSKECQVIDWAKHKKVCPLLAKLNVREGCCTEDSSGWKVRWYQRLQKKWCKEKKQHPILCGYHACS